MYQIDSEDANFLFMEKADSPTHISLVYLYDQSDSGDEPVRFKHVCEHIANRLYVSPVLRQKIQHTPGNIDYPYWIDDENFDLDFHVRHLALPKPGDWRQFCIQVSRLHSRPLDMSRALWELYIIEGLDNVENMPPNSFALYFKVHHCAMDEFTAQELLQSFHSKTPDRSQHETVSQHIAHPRAEAPSVGKMIGRGLVNNTSRSAKLTLQSVRNFRTLIKIMTRMSIAAAQNVSEGNLSAGNAYRFSQPLGQSRVFEGSFYPRDLFNEFLRLVDGATLTHAILTVCGEATRLYLEQHGESVDGSLKALLAVNVRNAGAHALLGNRVAINQVELHSTIIYPEGRLQAIVAADRELHSVEEAEITSFKLRSLYENAPAPLLAWLGKNANKEKSISQRIMKAGNLGLAELRDSEDVLYMLGSRLIGFTTLPPLYSGCGLMFAASSYHDNIGITFTSDRNIMVDPENMRKCLDVAVGRLESYLSERQAALMECQ